MFRKLIDKLNPKDRKPTNKKKKLAATQKTNQFEFALKVGTSGSWFTSLRGGKGGTASSTRGGKAVPPFPPAGVYITALVWDWARESRRIARPGLRSSGTRPRLGAKITKKNY